MEPHAFPLHMAAGNDDSELVELLLKHGADIEVKDLGGNTPLHRAVERHQPTTASSQVVAANNVKSVPDILLENKADVNATNFFGDTPLYRAASRGMLDIVRKMLEANGGNPNPESGSPLAVACLMENVELADILLKHGANPNRESMYLSSWEPSKCGLPLHVAAIGSNNKLVQLLLKHNAKIDDTDSSGDTALHHAIVYYNAKALGYSHQMVGPSSDVKAVVDVLLENKADINIANKIGLTPLCAALVNRMKDVVSKMLKMYGENDNQGLLLSAACLTGNVEMVYMLLQRGTDPNLVSTCHHIRLLPLLFAAENDNSKIVELLLEHGAKIDVTDLRGNTALHRAIEHRCQSRHNSNKVVFSSYSKSVIEFLLQRRVDVNIANESGETPLYRAAYAGMLDVVRKMLQVYGGNPNKGSPLTAACLAQNVKAVNMLLKHGADPNLCDADSKHELPLLVAADKDNSEVVELLLKHGANINVIKWGGTALHRAIAHRCESSQNSHEVVAPSNSKSVIDVLLENKADVNIQTWDGTPLYRAACGGMLDVVRKMLQKYGGNPNERSLLAAVCRAENVEMVDMLLKNGADPNLCDVYSKRQLPLLVAVDENNSKVVELLLKHGANVNITDGHGNTALHHAIERCSYQSSKYSEILVASSDAKSVIDVLLDNKADVNFLNDEGETPLCIAARKGFVDIVRKMLQVYGAKPNKGSPLVAACLAQNVEIVDMLLYHEPRADPNMQSTSCYADSKYKLPLFIAVDKGNSELVEMLLRHGASIDTTDSDGNTVLHHAVEKHQINATSSQYSDQHVAANIVKLVPDILLENRADVNIVNSSGETALYRAASRGLLDIVSKMLQLNGGNPNTGSLVARPLVAACALQNVELVDMLLKHGADPNLQSTTCHLGSKHKLPLFIAVDKGNSEQVTLLLRHGANIDTTDTDGNTALHYAIEYLQPRTSSPYSDEVVAVNGVKSVLEVLLENNADVNTVNVSGETPLYRAASRRLLDIVCKMLELRGGNPNTGSPDKSPLAAACVIQNVELVDVLLKHAADPNVAAMNCFPNSQHKLLLFLAVVKSNSDIVLSLLNAGANVNAVNDEGKSVVCFAAEVLASSVDDQSTQTTKLSVIRQLLKYGAHFNTIMPDGRSPLSLVANALERTGRYRGQRVACVTELLQLMVKHGTMLLYSSSQLKDDISCQTLNSETLKALATFDGEHKFIVDLLRAGATVQLIASFCNTVATTPRKVKSICLCQAAVLAGYTLSDKELQSLHRAGPTATGDDGLLEELVNWLNEDRQQPPSLLRQCRVVIRRQLSAAVHYQTILPAVDKLPLPNDLKLYLQFDGRRTEVGLSVNEKLQTREEGSTDTS